MPETPDDEPVERNTDQARQGVTGQGVRYVLFFGLLGVILAFILLLTI